MQNTSKTLSQLPLITSINIIQNHSDIFTTPIEIKLPAIRSTERNRTNLLIGFQGFFEHFLFAFGNKWK